MFHLCSAVPVPPMLWIPHQLVGSPLGRNVTLECFTEAHPNSLNYWTREDGQMIHDTKKYHIQSKPLEVPYKTQMMLTIVKLRAQDFGTYKCVAKNPRGETDGTIRLYASALMTTTPVPVTEEPVKQDTPVDLDGDENSLDPNYKSKKEPGRKAGGGKSLVKPPPEDREEDRRPGDSRLDNGTGGPRKDILMFVSLITIGTAFIQALHLADMANN